MMKDKLLFLWDGVYTPFGVAIIIAVGIALMITSFIMRLFDVLSSTIVFGVATFFLYCALIVWIFLMQNIPPKKPSVRLTVGLTFITVGTIILGLDVSIGAALWYFAFESFSQSIPFLMVTLILGILVGFVGVLILPSENRRMNAETKLSLVLGCWVILEMLFVGGAILNIVVGGPYQLSLVLIVIALFMLISGRGLSNF